MKQIYFEENKINESLKAEIIEIRNESQRLKDEVVTLEIELCQSELFVKSGLVEKYSQVKSGLLRTEVEKDLMKDNSHRSSGTARYDSEYSRSGLSEL